MHLLMRGRSTGWSCPWLTLDSLHRTILFKLYLSILSSHISFEDEKWTFFRSSIEMKTINSVSYSLNTSLNTQSYQYVLLCNSMLVLPSGWCYFTTINKATCSCLERPASLQSVFMPTVPRPSPWLPCSCSNHCCVLKRSMIHLVVAIYFID